MARIMIGAGGTGGHIYPALAVVEALQRRAPDAHTLTYVGSNDGFERPLIEQSGVALAHYYEVAAGPLNGVGAATAALSMAKIARGIAQSARIIMRHQPQVLLLTGGWANVPVALAAFVLRVPILLYLPDVEPGKTIQYLARIAAKVAVTVPDSARYFAHGQSVMTGYPLRQNVLSATHTAAQAHFALDAQRPVLLVFGGSRGARSLNQALEAILPQVLALGVQVLHVTGSVDWERSQAVTRVSQTAAYQAFAYLHDTMGLALAAADLVVCRAGASALGELPFFGLPSILVPYPHAWQYQKTNADYLAQRGAAIRMNDDSMTAELLPTLRKLLADQVQLQAMRQAAAQLAGDGAAAIAQQLLIMAGDSA